ncbi:CPS export outer membrane protein [Striga asiatica]|uniref:CPS export outer membrane protein n=1 Tax=Striga asiatica TaxID=4170 RepID=A0A5A7P3E9_STRAF|nr:CPS export outer membrane protein [Striga asiatica]
MVSVWTGCRLTDDGGCERTAEENGRWRRRPGRRGLGGTGAMSTAAAAAFPASIDGAIRITALVRVDVAVERRRRRQCITTVTGRDCYSTASGCWRRDSAVVVGVNECCAGVRCRSEATGGR